MKSLAANVAGLGYCRIEFEGGVIGRVSRVGNEDPAAPYCSPGLVDLQINGFAGVDFSAPDLKVEDLARVLPILWATGCTSFCPTLITNSPAELERGINLLEAARRSVPDFAASVPCYHLEGPYLSPGPSHGAHDPKFMHAADWAEFQRLQQTAGGNIGILTLAPEVPGAIDLTRRASRSGVIVAISHTDGTVSDVHHAVAAGATLSTHLGNGCPAMIHRHTAPFWGQLASDGLYASIICDGFHLTPEVVKIIHRVKGTDRCILVTDAVHVANLPPGRYELVGKAIELKASGQVLSANGGSMAGSTLAMNQAVANFRRDTGLPLADALLPATRTPARLLGKRTVCREIVEGEVANLVLFQPRDDRIEILQTFIGGRLAHG